MVCAPDLDKTAGLYYLHMKTPKEIDPKASDRAFGERIFEKAIQLLEERGEF